MAQHLFPLFGEYDDDQALARAAGNQAGVTALPQLSASLVGGNWTIGLDVNSSLGFWAWRTAWDLTRGSFTIVEDALVQFLSGAVAPVAGQSRNVLLVGWWKWVAGQIDGTGQPLGTFTTAQQAVYTAVSGADATSPVDPTVAATDGYGRKSVVLARVVLTNTTATIQWLPRTRLDLAEMGADIDSRMKRVGDEAHIGKFSVDTAPVLDNDVVRKADIVSGFAHPYANAQSFTALATTNYSEATGTPVPLHTVAASGVNVTNTTGNLVAQQAGYYAVDFAFKQHGSPIANGYLTGMWAVKLASNPAAGFATEVFRDHDYFGSGKSEACVPGTILIPMEVGDTLGAFLTSDSFGEVAMTAKITYLGSPAPTSVLTILTGSQTITEDAGQTFPASIAFNLVAANAVGVVTWSIDAAGVGQIDGTTDPAATIINGSQLQIHWTAAPSPLPKAWDVKLRAVDGSGAIATKTITITLQAVQPLAITTPNQFVSGYSVDYPLAVTFQATSSGGAGTVTYSIVADANTTLPSAAITGTTVTGSATAGGTYKVHLHAVDSSTPTPQTADLVVTITATVLTSGGGGGGCFVPGTEVLMADGSAKAIELVEVGDELLTIGAEDHQSGLTTVRKTIVEALLPYRERVKLITVCGATGTDYHRYATLLVEEGARMWTAARHLAVGLQLRGLDDQHQPIAIEQPTFLQAGETNEVHNLRTDLLSFVVRGGPGKPWLLVHNMKIQTPY